MIDSNESSLESDLNEEKRHKHMEQHTEIFTDLSKFEKKLIRGLMGSLSNIVILWLISKERQHGYEIMTKLHESAPYESKRPSASKIYPVLHDLEKSGSIRGSWEHHGKRKIKYYEITEEGRKSILRFKKLIKHAKENHTSLWIEFLEDMNSVEDINEL